LGEAINKIAIFSDGIEYLILDEIRRRVHAPALRPIFDWLRTARAGEGSRALDTYLGSNHINSRTDDDKTLLMAIRAAD
jgi:hypothetical protein